MYDLAPFPKDHLERVCCSSCGISSQRLASVNGVWLCHQCLGWIRRYEHIQKARAWFQEADIE
ncbi:hypothetical protein NOC27_3030 [Nitrosococcus oceani AFC27]|nr:hypothetical protein NOC27_3030 [Nitrosococcus oceani AFC27]